ncbi:glycosyltransferase [Aquisalinus flavus]|uniref:Glycosyltransferase 2-like domain-containing protein n=1 Tax=Aquisalinus flavus TaxID=1526572 RepID=A0A8J2Y7Y7_9PROT|nr:glycosyltransferase [Aquisalinus flavus]MBD0426230.1 glycosyltransferase [Aquisalinus flavus]UNE48198.1 glycosyltransferase [Aquisalinus flavus]GGD09573.1 hypothetical protein GCM10011342_18070 [Aquisalinus flavus]
MTQPFDLKEAIKQTGIFHEAWYLLMYPDVRNSGQPALDHYLQNGINEDRCPHPFFIPAYYYAHYPDVVERKQNAISHYLRHGGRERRKTSPLVDVDQYYRLYGDLVLKTSTQSVLEDFVKSRDRHKAFVFLDADYYRDQASNDNKHFNRLLEHFLTEGLENLHDPHRLLQLKMIGLGKIHSERFENFCNLFQAGNRFSNVKTHPLAEPEFFIKKHGQPLVNPTIEFLKTWRKQKSWLNPLFDVAFYMRRHKLKGDQPDPFSHYLQDEESQMGEPNPYFDPKFYTKHWGDRLEPGQHPIEHYVKNGHLPWFQPSERFGQRYYFTRHPEVATSGGSALLHFLHAGLGQGEAPKPPEPFFDDTQGLTDDEIVALIKALPEREGEPEVSVVIPVYKNLYYTLRCIYFALKSRDGTPFELIVADDQSPDGSGEYLMEKLDGIPGITVRINEENLGFLLSCNAAAASCEAPYLFFLNNDTVVLDGWLDELMDTVGREKDVGLVGSKLIYPNGLLQEAGGIIWEDASGANFGRMDDPTACKYNYMRDVDFISGAAIMVSRENWEKVGGFSEELAPAYYEDVDIAFKLRDEGLRVIYQPRSVVVHFEGISSGTDITTGVKRFQAVNKEKMQEKWKEKLKGLGTQGDYSLEIIDRRPKGRILIYDAEIPQTDKDAGSLLAYYYMKIFCELGYRVTFIGSNLVKGGRYATQLQKFGVEVIHTPFAQNARKYVLDNGHDFDMFLLSRAPAGGELFAELKQSFPEKPIVFDTVDLHHLRLMRQFELSNDIKYLHEANKMKDLEYKLITSADATILVSDFEIDLLRSEIGPFPSVVIPLIYEKYDRIAGFKDRIDIAFVGNYRHTPNVDAVRYLVEKVWPRFREYGLDARLHIIGSHMGQEFDEFVEDDINLVGFVEDLDGYLADIRMTVAPLRYGAGVKGKVGNSLRLGVPTVASPIAAEGMALKHEETLLVASSAESFAKEMKRLYTDEDLWEKLSRNGQEHVISQFGVDAARKKLAALCKTLIDSRKS